MGRFAPWVDLENYGSLESSSFMLFDNVYTSSLETNYTFCNSSSEINEQLICIPFWNLNNNLLVRTEFDNFRNYLSEILVNMKIPEGILQTITQ